MPVRKRKESLLGGNSHILPTTSFYDEVAERYKDLNLRDGPLPLIPGDQIPIFTYQQMPREFMQREDARGLLIQHALGSGKTLTAIGIAETSGRKVVCLLPARLKSEFIKELKKFGRSEFHPPKNYRELPQEERRRIDKEVYQRISTWYTFISYNSANLARDLQMVGNLNDKIMVIDEVHTLLARIISPSAKIGDQVYQMVMGAPELKIVALSGTPAISDPFELCVLFNMLRGPLLQPREGTNKSQKGGLGRKHRNETTLFPQDYREFTEYFVDKENNRIRNREVFQDRITGLVSYYPGLYDEAGNIIPRTKPIELVRIHMSEYQWNTYVSRRRVELDAERRDKYNTQAFTYLELKKPKRQSVSTYKQGSIQAGLFVPPDYIKIPTKKELAGRTEAEIRRIRSAEMDRIRPTDLQLPALDEFSAKFADILRKLDTRRNQITFIYSNMDVMGVGAMSRVLDANGWNRWRRTPGLPRKHVVVPAPSGLTEEEVASALEEPDPDYDPRIGSSALEGGMPKIGMPDWEGDERYGGAQRPMDGIPTYAVIYGDTSEEEKAEIIETVCNPDNRYGANIRVLMGTKVIAEGVDLKNIRTVIFLEAQWKRMRTNQVIGRAARLNSHRDLPIEEREVEVFMYIAEPPEGVKVPEALTGDTEMVDMQLYRKSNDEGRLLDTYFEAIREVGIDCRLNLPAILKKFPDARCRSCLPTGRELIPMDVKQHILNGTRCETESRKGLRRITLDGQELRQDREGLVYRWDTRVEGWVHDAKLTSRWEKVNKAKQ